MTHIVAGAFLLSGRPGYRQAGVHVYARELLRHLPDVVEQGGARLTALISPSAGAHVACRAYAVARELESPPARIWTEQITLPRLLRQLGADLYHGLGFVAPLRAPCPTIITVFDLSFITQPRTHKLLNRVYLSLFTRWSCHRAARVIAISEWTKHDLLNHFGLDEGRVDVTPLGVDHERFRPLSIEQAEAFRAQHHIREHAIFFLGSLEPRKNLARLIEAFCALRRTLPDAQLFIGGSPAWHYHDLLRSIRADANDGIHLLGRVDDTELPLWYNACAVTAYPSLYEGFGLPPLEAMACGAVVVASNTTSLPEVVGEAGVLVNPYDVTAMSHALRVALTNQALRQKLKAEAIARARQFTWARTAELTWESYRAALETSQRRR